MAEKKPITKRWWFWVLVVFFGLVILGAIIGDDEDTDTSADASPEPSIEAEATPEAEPTIEPDQTMDATPSPDVDTSAMSDTEYLEYAVRESLGTEVNTGKPRFIGIEESDTAYTISLNGNDNLTTNMIRGGMLIDASDVFEKIYERDFPDKNIWVLFYFPLVDKYGNESDEYVLGIMLDQPTADMINWDNFLYDNFPDIAVEYFEHPAFSN